MSGLNLNRDLFDDEKDYQIAVLKFQIEKFKEYDKKRKEYYSEKMIRLGKLESYVQELEAEDTKSLRSKLSLLKKQVASLTLKLNASNVTLDEFDEFTLKGATIFHNIREENKLLRKRVEEQKNTINRLLYEINFNKK